MTGPERSDEALITLAGILVGEQGLDQTLRQVLELACAVLPGGDEGGVILLEAEGPRTPGRHQRRRVPGRHLAVRLGYRRAVPGGLPAAADPADRFHCRRHPLA